MQRNKAIHNMMSAGLSSEAAEAAVVAGFTLTRLRDATKKELKDAFGWRAQEIKDRLQRAPIPDDVVAQLVERCDWSCCVCWDLDNQAPVILHHIEEHSKGGDDSYANLVVLCLNHHAVAHSRWDISRHPTPKEYLRQRKTEFEVAIHAFKAGQRAAPGREGDGSDPDGQSDRQALQRLAEFLDRPAVSRRFHVEGNMRDFLKAMDDVMRALNTGLLRTREGDEIRRTKGVRSLSNPNWQERLLLVRDQFDTTRARVELAIRDGELMVRPEDGFYSFRNPELPSEIDRMREAAVSILNSVLQQAGIREIRPPADSY